MAEKSDLKKIVVVKPCLWGAPPREKVMSRAVGTILEVTASEANELIHYHKASEYNGACKHLETDLAFSKSKAIEKTASAETKSKK